MVIKQNLNYLYILLCIFLEVDEFCKKIGDGMFIFPGDCQRYVDCEKGVAYIAKCLDGKAWDNDVKRCEPAEEVGCKNEF